MQNDNLYLTAQQSFNLQYITVILIILAFLVGTFSSRKMDKGKEAPAIAVAAAESAPAVMLPEAHASLKSVFEYTDLFENESFFINSEKVEALATLLSNHDLTAKIYTNLGFCKNKENTLCFKQEMQAVKNLSDYFRSKNLPFESFEIYYAPQLENAQTEITFFTDKP